jgi:hypothetical protein
MLSGVSPQSSHPDALRIPERPRYPLQMLTHCYVPFGVKRGPEIKSLAMDVDPTDLESRDEGKSKKHDLTSNDGQEVKTKSKKRKKHSALEESSVPKKSKRAKQAA